MPVRHFLRSDIFTVAIGCLFYFRLFLQMNKIVILMEKFSLFWYTNTALEIEQ